MRSMPISSTRAGRLTPRSSPGQRLACNKLTYVMTAMLRGKIAIVTGASSGLGRAIAICFAAEGAVVVVADVRTLPLEGGDSTTEIISLNGGSATFEKTDVSRWKDIDALVTQTVARHGRLDIMVNNAAIFSATGLLDTTGAQWQQVLDVNLTGMFNGCKRAVQQMITQEPRAEVRGRIINLGSQQGIISSPHDTAYGVSKAGAIYLTRQIAVDYADRLIVCNCISPGKIMKRPDDETDPELENARRRTPWPRLGRPQDIANAAAFLASDRATYITGANMIVDGGWLAR
jgi:glucose 1-dehydrogenase